ncbi:hypothetical protein CKA32_007004 [Geitlerinema sp. FC II]|nr:hypothetical protein CKA32_007004 [Geitlerinema sp. FC II]
MKNLIRAAIATPILLILATPIARHIFWVREQHRRNAEIEAWCKSQRPQVEIQGWTRDKRPNFCKGGDDTDG